MQHPWPLQHAKPMSRCDELLALLSWDPFDLPWGGQVGKLLLPELLGSQGAGARTPDLTAEPSDHTWQTQPHLVPPLSPAQ